MIPVFLDKMLEEKGFLQIIDKMKQHLEFSENNRV
jgi:hypothetical protein